MIEYNRTHNLSGRDAETSGHMTKTYKRGLDMNSITKKCSKCGEVKSINEFPKNKSRRDGVAVYCRPCYKSYTSSWYYANREDLAEYYKKYREENIQRIREYDRKRTPLRSEENAARYKKWKITHPERASEINIAAKFKRRTRINNDGGAITSNEWRELKKLYNYTCLCCRRKEPEIKLELDHVIPIKLGGSNTIDNAQPLCRSCNAKKHVKTIDYRKA